MMGMGDWDDPRYEGWWRGHRRHEERRHRRGMRRLRRGVLKFALLKLLDELPRHGYDLIRAVREKGWGGGAGSIYPLLAALEAAGLIAGREEGDRRIYEVTEEGRRHLGEHAAELQRFLDENENAEEEEAEDPAVAHLRDSARRLMQAIAQLGPSSKPETIQRVSELLKAARKEIYELLAEE
ncbi:MAG TPA: PadR family transcriptional regulator [Candidatus Babeliales bacterium]|nr:PadR family transcriptional regulator [Candidatus Babeliales bacterium]